MSDMMPAALKEADRMLKSWQRRIYGHIAIMQFIQSINEPMYINPPGRVMLSNLAVSMFILLLCMICAYKALAILFCVYLIYFVLSMASFGKAWQLFGYSKIVLALIIISGIAAEAVIALVLQKYFIALLRYIYSG